MGGSIARASRNVKDVCPLVTPPEMCSGRSTRPPRNMLSSRRKSSGRSFQGTVVLGNGARYTGVSLTQGIAAQTQLVDAANAGGDLCQLGAPLDPAKVTGKIVLCRRGVNERDARHGRNSAIHGNNH